MEAELKRCSRCSHRGPPEDYINNRGFEMKKCKKCQKNYNATRKRMIERREALITTDTKICASCIKPRFMTEFNTLPDGSLTKVCSYCCRRNVVRATESRKLESVKIKRRKTRKDYRKKMKHDKEWMQRQRDIENKSKRKNSDFHFISTLGRILRVH